MLRKTTIFGLACALTTLVALPAGAAGPRADVYPSSLSFGEKQVGTTTEPQVVSVYNSQSEALVISAVSITGTGAAQFEIPSQNCAGATLAQNQSCSIQTRFSPTSEGDHLASLDIFSNDPLSPARVPMSGKGVPPALAVYPSSIDFGAVQTGASSGIASVYVSNDGRGNGPVTMGTATLTGPQAAQFSIVSDTCSGRTLLSRGLFCQIDLRLSPVGVGGKTATLRIPSSAPTSPDQVTLIGSGFDAALYVWPSPASFPQQMVNTISDPVTVSVSRATQGTEPIEILSLSLTGADASQFEIVNDTCSGATLQGYQYLSCNFGLRFRPTSEGQKVATVQIPSSSPGAATTVPVNGSAVTRVESLTVAPLHVNFGQVEVGSSAQDYVTVTNTGNTSVTITDVGVEGSPAFTADEGCTGYPLWPGGACYVSIDFQPTATGPQSATLMVSTSLGGAPYEVDLDGTGTDTTPPGSSITTPENAPLVSTLNTVAGTTTDNMGVAGVRVTFTHALGMSMTVDADLTCSLAGKYCEWTAPVPLMAPGPVTVNARGTDVNTNPELPGPSVMVLVV